jgi:diaminopropionate ammonia-lyase
MNEKRKMTFSCELAANPACDPVAPYGDRQKQVLNAEGLAAAREAISAWPGYAPTPLVSLPGLARELRIGALLYKQEDARFGLRSFKPLGGAYAVFRRLQSVIRERTGDTATVADVLAGRYREIAAGMTVTAATDGNHGRSVAWGARMFGCRCVIYINESVSGGRERAIASYGADVRRNPGSYDDAVRKAFAMAESEGWHVIPDTSDGKIVEAPRDVTQGYAVMAAEAIEQLGKAPDMIFLQAGVGGMAAATCAQYWQEYGSDRPVTITVEPEQCACWYHSLKDRKPTVISGDIDSFMAGLACGEVSSLAWEILEPGAHFAMTVEDDAAACCMRLLADPPFGDPPLIAGESGVAGLVGLIAVTRNEELRTRTGLNENSTVVVFGTEGATDPVMYEQIVGRGPEAVVS